MSIDLIKAVQENLHYPPLQKIDPNTEAVVEDASTPDEDKFSQAAISGVLTAMYNYVQSDEGADDFLRGNNSSNWVTKIFDENKKEAVQKISSYSNQLKEDLIIKMNEIANEAENIVKEKLPQNATIKDVKHFFTNQRNNILLYLPSALKMGELLKNNTLDDNVNKMEGPLSSLAQKIGTAFSPPVTEDDLKKSNEL
jgi:hypothetical protein